MLEARFVNPDCEVMKMYEDKTDRIFYKEYVDCPKCGEPIKLDLNFSQTNLGLHMWFEGLCLDCFDVIVDPMPVLTDMSEENRRLLWRILGN